VVVLYERAYKDTLHQCFFLPEDDTQLPELIFAADRSRFQYLENGVIDVCGLVVGLLFGYVIYVSQINDLNTHVSSQESKIMNLSQTVF